MDKAGDGPPDCHGPQVRPAMARGEGPLQMRPRQARARVAAALLRRRQQIAGAVSIVTVCLFVVCHLAGFRSGSVRCGAMVTACLKGWVVCCALLLFLWVDKCPIHDAACFSIANCFRRFLSRITPTSGNRKTAVFAAVPTDNIAKQQYNSTAQYCSRGWSLGIKIDGIVK